MVDYVIYISISTVILVFGLIAYHFVHDWYKEKQWRRNNPDEHEIMNRKIKDDFTR